MSASNIERASEIFREVLELGDRDPRQAERGDDWSWDSLNHVLLVGALESEFGVSIDLSVSIEIHDFSAAIAALKDLGVAFEGAAQG